MHHLIGVMLAQYGLAWKPLQPSDNPRNATPPLPRTETDFTTVPQYLYTRRQQSDAAHHKRQKLIPSTFIV
jgi:hypothetical protein